VRIVDLFGTQSVNDLNGDTIPDLEGDFNLDGQYDVGGPVVDNPRGHFYLGSSLGGIMGDINMGVNPRILVGAPVSGAGGLPDVIPRSHQRSATRPTVLQLAGPVIVGNSVGVPGFVDLVFNDDPPSEVFGYLIVLPFGQVRVKNIVNGEVKYTTADADGNFAVGIPADVGDLLEITSLDGLLRPLVKIQVNSKYKGTGLERNTPDIRRFISLAQWMIERGDPINLAKHYFTNEFGAPLAGAPDKSVLLINTIGDRNVPINTGIVLNVAAGLWTLGEVQTLIDEGLNLGYTPPPWGTSQTDEPIYDPEDVDDDDCECGFPSGDPRCTNCAPATDPAPIAPVPVAGGQRVSAARLHYVRETGHHAFALPGDREHGIDWGVYMMNQIGYYFASDGTCVIDDPWELHSAPHIHPGTDGILQSAAGMSPNDRLHTVRVLTTLGAHPCDYDFPTIDVITTGPNWDDSLDHGGIDSAVQGDDVLINFDDLYRGP